MWGTFFAKSGFIIIILSLAIVLGLFLGLLFEGWMHSWFADTVTTGSVSRSTKQPVRRVSAKPSPETTDDSSSRKTVHASPVSSPRTVKSTSSVIPPTTVKYSPVIPDKSPVTTPVKRTVSPGPVNSAPPGVQVKYKVRVGPYPNREQALAARKKLEGLGYTGFVTPNSPFVVQIGAFTTSENADRLKEEVAGKGYQVFIAQEQ